MSKQLNLTLKMKIMTTISKFNLLFLILILYACSIQKDYVKQPCSKVKIESSTDYQGRNQTILKNVEDFNSGEDKTIDILSISSSSGYDYRESFKRVYIISGKVFMVDDENTRELSINSKDLESVFADCNDIKTLVNCSVNSSNNNIYRFFVKKNNIVVMTFTANNLLAKIDKTSIKEELKFIKPFEEMK